MSTTPPKPTDPSATRLHRTERTGPSPGDLLYRLPVETEATRSYREALALEQSLGAELQRVQRSGVPAGDLVERVVRAQAATRAAKVAADREGSSQLDPWIFLALNNVVVPPRYNPDACILAVEESDILTRCCTTMAQNVAGLGYELEMREGLKEQLDALGEAERKALEKEMQAERRAVMRFFRFVSPKHPWQKLARLTVLDKEEVGHAALEVIPSSQGNGEHIAGLQRMHGREVRLTPASEAVDTPMPIQEDDGTWTSITVPQRFHKVVQLVNGRYRYFREAGDPRVIDRETGAVAQVMEAEVKRLDQAERDARAGAFEAMQRGEVSAEHAEAVVRRAGEQAEQQLAGTLVAQRRAPTADAGRRLIAEARAIVAEGRQAHEVILFIHEGIGGGITPYGIPRWIGTVYSAKGRKAAAEVNLNFFDNNAIPDLLVMVDGGSLTQQADQAVKDLFKEVKGRDNFRGTVLVLDALPATADNLMADEKGPPVRIHVEHLSRPSEDGLFRDYSKDGMNDVRRSFGIPPIILGDSDDYNRATVETAQEVAEQQSFDPERMSFDHTINNKLFPRLDVGRDTPGVRYWTYRSKRATIANAEAANGMIATGLQHGSITPDESRPVIARFVGERWVPTGKTWMQRPSSINAGLAQQGVDFTQEGAQPPAPAGQGDQPEERRLIRVAVTREQLDRLNAGEAVEWLMQLRDRVMAELGRRGG